jgi:hypothetical protein
MKTPPTPSERRRYRLLYGQGDGAGYVVTDTEAAGADWRGQIVFKSDSRGDAEAEADRLNQEAP